MSLLAHRLSGRGEPLLLLNGGLMTYAAWDPVAALLPRHALVACDLRGQLLSPGPPPARVEGHVADVVALLDHLGLRRVHVLGTSFGGFVSLLLAAARPERVASLTLAASAARVDDAAWEHARPVIGAARAALDGGDPGAVFDALVPWTFAPAFRAAYADALALRRAQFAQFPRAWFEGLLGLLGSLHGLDLRPRLASVRAPALVVAAELDATFPLDVLRELHAGLTDARFEVVAGAGHALVAEQPQALAALAQAFLDAQRGSAPIAGRPGEDA